MKRPFYIRVVSDNEYEPAIYIDETGDETENKRRAATFANLEPWMDDPDYQIEYIPEDTFMHLINAPTLFDLDSIWIY